MSGCSVSQQFRAGTRHKCLGWFVESEVGILVSYTTVLTCPSHSVWQWGSDGSCPPFRFSHSAFSAEKWRQEALCESQPDFSGGAIAFQRFLGRALRINISFSSGGKNSRTRGVTQIFIGATCPCQASALIRPKERHGPCHQRHVLSKDKQHTFSYIFHANTNLHISTECVSINGLMICFLFRETKNVEILLPCENFPTLGKNDPGLDQASH